MVFWWRYAIFLLFTENQWVLPVSFPLLVCTLTVPLRGFPVYIFYFPQKQTNKQTQHSNLNDFTLTGARSQEKQTQISHPSTLKNPYDISTTWRKAQVELVVFTCVVSSEQNPLKTTRRVPAGVRHNKVSRQWRRKLKRWGSDQICYFPNGKYFVLVNY